jgi:hypothetical protein
MSSKKCPQCGLVNFAGSAACKRCSGPLADAETVPNEVGPPPVVNVPAQVQATSNLVTCPDCNGIISRHAEFCIHCGRFLQALRPIVSNYEPNRWWWAQTIGWGIITSGLIVALIFVILIELLGGLGALFASGARP